MDKEIMEQFQMIMDAIGNMESKMLTKDDIEPISDRSASKAAALTEETLGKRIDSLFDGYKLTHEKQFELERRVEKLEQIIADLQNRIA